VVQLFKQLFIFRNSKLSNILHSNIYFWLLEKQIDLVNANFKKMKVKELKKILAIWNEDCKGCTEKSEFIARVEKLMPTYAPEAAAARAAAQKSEL